MLTVSGLAATSVALFSYDAPALSALATPNAASTGGALLTLLGLSFAAIDLTPAALAGPAACQTTAWASNSAVVCLAPSGSGTAHAVATVAGLAGSKAGLFTFDAPTVTAAAAPGFGANAPATGGARPSLLGANFGAADPSASARLGVTACLTTTWQSATSAACAAPASAGAGLAAGLTVAALAGTLPASFTIDAPVVSALRPANAATSTALLTLRGHGFGAADATGTAAVHARDCASTAWTSATAAQCWGTGEGGAATVQVRLSSLPRGSRRGCASFRHV